MIYYITPFANDKRYGKALNDHIKLLPDDSYVCVRDLDTLVFSGTNLEQILMQAVKDNPETDLFTCATNRAWNYQLLRETNITWHKKEAKNRSKKYTEITGIVPAFFWFFHKTIWIERPFDNLPIIHNRRSFDVRWTQHNLWKKTRIEHLYIFHDYRLGQPVKNYSHLV